MTTPISRSLLLLLLSCSAIFAPAAALQVAPNSGCASVCVDSAGLDLADPESSNTYGSDIVCRDQDYGKPTGKKYQSCVDCLQHSAATSDTESDLQWFLYNLRFAVNSCVFGINPPSDEISSPCSIQLSCGPLIGAMQDGMSRPVEEDRYSYCSAFGSSFMGPRLQTCTNCLKQTSDQNYMSNFLIALRAGCIQRPEKGKLISLEGNLFSEESVNITSLDVAPVGIPKHEGLHPSEIIGIVVGSLVAVTIIAAVIFICVRKRQARERLRLSSTLDDRYGSKEISNPVGGSYGDARFVQPDVYENVGLTKMPSGVKTTVLSRTNQDPELYQSPPAAYSPPPRQMELSHGTGVAVPYNPSQHPAQANSYTPSHYSSYSSPGIPTPKSMRSPKQSPGITRDHYNRSNISELPTPIPTPHTRDLTQRHAGPESDTRSMNISGPIITVNTRLDDEEEARRRRERELLYKRGFVNTQNLTPQNVDDDDSPSPQSAEQWPGRY